MTQRSTYRNNESICIGCLGEFRPTRSHVRRAGSSTFCRSCRVSNGEPRWIEQVSASNEGTAALALIGALGFWLDA